MILLFPNLFCQFEISLQIRSGWCANYWLFMIGLFVQILNRLSRVRGGEASMIQKNCAKLQHLQHINQRPLVRRSEECSRSHPNAWIYNPSNFMLFLSLFCSVLLLLKSGHRFKRGLLSFASTARRNQRRKERNNDCNEHSNGGIKCKVCS